jgi:glycosyltransferase involved in cell wall biosynthesis
VARAESRSWPGSAPAVTIVIATHNRVDFLGDLLVRLTSLDPPAGQFEVVIVDDGSQDGTWTFLQEAATTTTLCLLALRISVPGGPAAARNTAALHGRGNFIVCTDDDCLPEPGWVSALVAPFVDERVTLAQGTTLPEKDNPLESSPWSRSMHIATPTVLFEACNIAYRRNAFEEAGGFPVGDPLAATARGRAAGEDVILGARLAEAGRAAFVADALVRHRWLPGRYLDVLQAQRLLSRFPWFARDLPVVADGLPLRWFLSRRTLAVDAGVAGLLLGAAIRRPWPIVVALPWAVHCWRDARWKPGQARSIRAVQVAVIDLVGMASLLEGSIRARRVLL